MIETPSLSLPAPWGAAVAIGLIQVVPQPKATPFRGQIEIIQGPSYLFTPSQRCLITAAQRKRMPLFSGTDYIRLCLKQGMVGFVDIVDCWALNDPNCPFGYESHFNLGQNQTPYPYLWVLANARTTSSDPNQSRKPLPAEPVQSVLFSGEMQ